MSLLSENLHTDGKDHRLFRAKLVTEGSDLSILIDKLLPEEQVKEGFDRLPVLLLVTNVLGCQKARIGTAAVAITETSVPHLFAKAATKYGGWQRVLHSSLTKTSLAGTLS